MAWGGTRILAFFGVTVDMLRAAGFATIKGNHDHATATGLNTRGINQAAKWAIDWSREELTEEELKWLDDLPSFTEAEAESIFQREGVEFMDTSGSSIEEIASKILQQTGLRRRSF